MLHQALACLAVVVYHVGAWSGLEALRALRKVGGPYSFLPAARLTLSYLRRGARRSTVRRAHEADSRPVAYLAAVASTFGSGLAGALEIAFAFQGSAEELGTPVSCLWQVAHLSLGLATLGFHLRLRAVVEGERD